MSELHARRSSYVISIAASVKCFVPKAENCGSHIFPVDFHPGMVLEEFIGSREEEIVETTDDDANATAQSERKRRDDFARAHRSTVFIGLYIMGKLVDLRRDMDARRDERRCMCMDRKYPRCARKRSIFVVLLK